MTIGVFVRPGDLPAHGEEHDGTAESLLRVRRHGRQQRPLPRSTSCCRSWPSEFDLKLSTSGNDRCIAGGSSGGIAAFNAAWERPDAFSRVYANSGSFVAFRGGHEFPTLVRKFEAKPIRAYLTTGTRDMENCAGDWFLLDQEMDKALRFSGYDYFLPDHQRRARRRLLRLLPGSDELPLERLAAAGPGRAERAAGARHHPARRGLATRRPGPSRRHAARPCNAARRGVLCGDRRQQDQSASISTGRSRSSCRMPDHANSLSVGPKASSTRHRARPGRS